LSGTLVPAVIGVGSDTPNGVFLAGLQVRPKMAPDGIIALSPMKDDILKREAENIRQKLYLVAIILIIVNMVASRIMIITILGIIGCDILDFNLCVREILLGGGNTHTQNHQEKKRYR
jgi:hypothetical protein